jgi:rsbT co-antagonist protein RsbR
MPHKHFMATLHLDEQELQSRRAFFELTDTDLAKLASLRPFAEKHMSAIVESFYELLLNHRETRRFFPDDATVRRVKEAQREYFLGLFAGKCDLAYVEDRLRVGAAHERIGLAPKWYLGGYRRYMDLMCERLAADMPTAAELRDAMRSIQKIVYFDMALAIDTYIAAHADTLRRHQQAIRELSTPVIRVYEGVLLMPLVGAIDSLRASQIMESVLSRVADDQARVLILDIAGVAVVDTKVADNLVKTTAQVARTMVQLGVELSAMHTRSRLAEGIELALDIVGKAIRPKEAR